MTKLDKSKFDKCPVSEPPIWINKSLAFDINVPGSARAPNEELLRIFNEHLENRSRAQFGEFLTLPDRWELEGVTILESRDHGQVVELGYDNNDDIYGLWIVRIALLANYPCVSLTRVQQ